MKALIIHDLQNDFHPAGMFPIAGSDELVAIANEQVNNFDLVIATQFWYPPDHIIFAANHLWRKPEQVIEKEGFTFELKEMHCIADSFGAELMMGLDVSRIDHLIQKGSNKEIPSEDAFYDADGSSTGLLDLLKENGIKQISLMGISVDESIRKTGLKSRQLGFETGIILKGSRGIYPKNEKD